MKHNKRFFLLVISFAASLLFSPVCSWGDSEDASEKSNLLMIGYRADAFLGVDTRDAQLAMNLWSEQISRKFGRLLSTEAVIIDDLPQMLKAIKAKEVDFVTLNSLDYLEVKDEYGLGALTLAKEMLEYKILLLVNSDTQIKALKDLRRRNLITGGVRSKLAFLWLDTMLLRAGLKESDDFLSRIKKTKKESAAVLAVFFGQTDACLVSERVFETMAELNPQLKQKLVVLAASPVFTESLLCAREDVADEDKMQLVESALVMHEDSRGQQILMLFHISQLLKFEPGHLDTVIALVAEYNKLKTGR